MTHKNFGGDATTLRGDETSLGGPVAGGGGATSPTPFKQYNNVYKLTLLLAGKEHHYLLRKYRQHSTMYTIQEDRCTVSSHVHHTPVGTSLHDALPLKSKTP